MCLSETVVLFDYHPKIIDVIHNYVDFTCLSVLHCIKQYFIRLVANICYVYIKLLIGSQQ